MSKTLMQSTQVCISLSINVITKNDNGVRLDTLRLVYLTGLVMLLWRFGNWKNRIAYRLARVARDTKQKAGRLGERLLSLGFRPLVFGVG